MGRERSQAPNNRGRKIKIAAVAGAAGLLLAGTLAWVAAQQRAEQPTPTAAHTDITTTMFWIGEEGDESNGHIPNKSSTWTEDWAGAFGGVDDPDNRCNDLPCGFTPKENPFYFALPYSDLDDSCHAKPSQAEVPWYNGPPPEGESIVKNHWIKIEFDDKTAFAQWEDAGPFGEDDTKYVFGGAAPQAQAGLDVSPAVDNFLKLNGEAPTSWEFVNANDVPDGPWRQIITTSQSDCAK